MAEVRDVGLEEVPISGRTLMGRLMQLYLHDFSEFAPVGSAHGEVSEDGLFDGGTGLDRYWDGPDRIPLLIRADGHVAGFALVGGSAPLDAPVDHALAEFFVLRKYRRAGVGRRAARALFCRHPGRWQVGIASYNAPALAFWRAVARDLPGAEQRSGTPPRWHGAVLCFTTAAAG